jgi:1,2-diacylglycerol 3-alpha-glucosyltransferase
MNIMMMTNTYKPILGGLEKSVEAFTKELRNLGHRVLIVAPKYPGMRREEDVIRIPAVQNFNGSDFSVQLPIPLALTEALRDFKPDLIHSHHPFLIGDAALRAASSYNVPLVFTHHTLYEENVHYVPGNQEALKRFVIELSTGYANLADMVFAPSESVMNLMLERGVKTAIEVVPTGIYTDKFARGSKKSFCKKFNLPSDVFMVGYLGRLAPEKNLEFVTRAVTAFLKKRTDAHFLVCGTGPSLDGMRQILAEEGVAERFYPVGAVKGKDLIDAYHAMDVFVFASQSETQGLVLTEAMAAGVPIVAVDAPGVREVVKDGTNGRLLPVPDMEQFTSALEWLGQLPAEEVKKMKNECRQTAQSFAMPGIVKRVNDIYISLVVDGFIRRPSDDNSWTKTARLITAEWELIKNLTKATGAMMIHSNDARTQMPGGGELAVI